MTAHSHGPVLDVPTSPRVRRGLGAVVVALLLAAAAGILLTWPGEAGPRVGTPETGVVLVRGEVTATTARTCAGAIGEDRLPDGTIPAVVDCPDATVALEDGATATVTIPTALFRSGFGAGEAVVLARYPALDGQPETYAWQDVDRRVPLTVLVVVFVVATVAVGRRRGAAALVGLGLGGSAVGFYVLPALLAEEDPVVVSLSAATALMGVVIYLTHGISTRTTAAYLGTVAGLALTAAVAVVVVDANHLLGLDDESSYTVSVLTGAVDLRGVVIAGTLVAALGILNDVTITQASAVWEVRAAKPDATFRTLYAAGMRVGRDHLASTVYTVAFVYAGAALPTLLLIRLYDQPLGEVLTTAAIAEEVVRTAVGGIALAVTVPVTTALAAATITSRSRR